MYHLCLTTPLQRKALNLFQVEVTTVTSAHFSEWNSTTTESTYVFKFRVYKTKRWLTTTFEPFYFVYSNRDRLPDFMWPGLDPIKGFMICWKLPFISNIELENIMSHILLYSYVHINTLVNISICTIYKIIFFFLHNSFCLQFFPLTGSKPLKPISIEKL